MQHYHNSMCEKMIPLPATILLMPIFMIRCELINDPTLKPCKDFSPDNDAEAISRGDPETISRIIFHRTYEQRKKIEDAYYQNITPRAKSHSSLMDALKASSKDSLNDLYGMVLEPAEAILANSLRGNIHENYDPEVGAIEEVVCANDKEMKDRINKSYQTMFGKTVENELSGFKAHDKDYQKVMLKYCWEGLCQDKKITPQDVDKEAQALGDIHPNKKKTAFKNKLIELLDKYCEPDLKQIFQKYRQGDHGIENAVHDAFEVHRQRRAYHYLVRSIEDICKLYAFELRHAADDAANIHTDKINRIILSRCERDLFCIEKAYHEIHDGYDTFTSRLTHKLEVQDNMYDGDREYLYDESIRYLMGKP